jgi:hypothetical protein
VDRIEKSCQMLPERVDGKEDILGSSKILIQFGESGLISHQSEQKNSLQDYDDAENDLQEIQRP